MILLLLIISIAAAFFSAIQEKEDLLAKDIKPGYKISWLFIIVGIALYILFYNYWYSQILLISSGLIYTIISFIYLEILGNRDKLNHFAVQLTMVILLSAISKITWSIAIYIPLTFIFSYLGFTYSLKKLLRNPLKSSENVKQTLELSRVLNGILLLIIGLVLASDRIRFFEKIAQYLFN